MDEAGSGFSHSLARWLFVGPHGPDPHRRPTLGETLFPWPVRVLSVATAALLGWNWSGTPLGQQLGGGLQYVGLIAVSLTVSWWWWIFVFNCSFALAWLVWPILPAEDSPWASAVGHALTFINRQFGHIEVLSVWVVLALVATDRLTLQLALLVAVLALGEPLLSGLANWLVLARRRETPALASELYLKRRPLFYGATLLGFILVALLAPRQWFKLVPGVLAVVLGDLLRYLRHRRLARVLANAEESARLSNRHDKQRRWGRRTDALLGPGLVIAGFAFLMCSSVLVRRSYDHTLSKGTPSRGEPVDYCTSASPPAPEPDVAMFIVSDSQFHELGGHRFVGQMEFADALVPVALRPVELDVLSASPLSRAATVYAALSAERPAGSRLWWSHLGDMADLSCANEMDRSLRLLRERFDTHAFAGVAPGNHDKAFTGNFFWSPYWDSACPSGRLEKELSDQKVQQPWQESIAAAGGRMVAVSGWNPVAFATRRGSALVTATPLGVVRHHQDRRGLIGVFLDTSDGRALDFGVAGLFGTFSTEQAKTVTAVVEEVRKGAGREYENPVYVVFMHHPVDETSSGSNSRLKSWLATLDGHDNHLLGVVSAHTHEAQEHSHCIGRRMIPEVVVGSTIDPPQEAALLSVGPLADGTLGLRLQTLPMVARPGKTCASRAPAITSGECQRTVAGLRKHPDCSALFRPGEASALGRDCSDLENARELNDRLVQAARWAGPGDEEEIRADQRTRIEALWKCICRGQICTASPSVLDLDDDSYFALVRQELASSPAREQELVCLAWAGAAVQGKKTSGMSFADALRCAFDDGGLAPARDYIARLEVTPCY